MTFQNHLTVRARELRRHPTEAETRLWWVLRSKQMGVKFRRQAPIGPFIVDFVSLPIRLIIEADGIQHGAAGTDDPKRDAWLNAQGFHILRFSNGAVLRKTEGVLAIIADRIMRRQSTVTQGNATERVNG